MLKKRYFRVIFLFIVLFVFVPNDVLGVETFDSLDACYDYNHTDGSYIARDDGKNCSDHVKKSSDGYYAFCTEFTRAFNGTCSTDTRWKTEKKYAIITSYIVDTVFHDDKYINEKSTKKYGLASIAINAYLAHNYATSPKVNPFGQFSRGDGRHTNDGDYYKNKTIKAIIDTAQKKYVDLELGKKITAGLEVKNTILKLGTKPDGSKYYLSDEISATKLLDSVGGGKIDYKVTGELCDKKGENCKAAKDKVKFCRVSSCPHPGESINVNSQNNSFYLQVTGEGLENSQVKVILTGSNQTEYNSSILYDCGREKQHLLVTNTKAVSGLLVRNVTVNLNFVIPDPQKRQIFVSKVDENGDIVKGATMQLWKGNDQGATQQLEESKEASFSYDVSENSNDDVYYLREVEAPAGYVIGEEFRIGKVSSENSSMCYSVSPEGAQTLLDDNSPCEFDRYQFKCNPELNTDPNNLTDPDDVGNCGSLESDLDENTEQLAKICWDSKNPNNLEGVDNKYCEKNGNYLKVEVSGRNVFVSYLNVKNKVSISKRATTGNDEVAGAELKICTKASYDEKKNACEVAKTVDNEEMSWISGSDPVTWHGLPRGEYYIVETVPPAGYIKATQATSFSIDKNGKVTTGGTVLKEGDPIIVNNSLTSVSISKQDMATSQELPGATISICSTYKDENGNYQVYTVTDPNDDTKSDDCVSAVLADGTAATWVSGEKPHQIVGLPAGTYYLVERIAPKGYSTAESILFTMKEDGSIVDKDGNSIKDSKIVMKDSKMSEVKTGQFTTYVVMGLTIFVVGLGAVTYYLMNYKKVDVIQKIRKRKIHKTSL